MVVKRTLGLLLAFVLLIAACGQANETATAPAGPTGAPAGSGGQLTIWTKFNDQNPQNDQDRWLAATLAAVAKDGGLEVANVTQDYAQINSKLNLAVTSGGDIPDLSYVDSQQLGFYIKNGTLEDLTEYVKSAPWFSDLSPAALAACTAPDGTIYCVPGNLNSRLTYYWVDQWPNGFPKDTQAFLQEAERIKQADPDAYAITFKGSEPAASEGLYFGLIRSFGGSYADAEGRAAWATPETAAAVAFFRELFTKKYAPDVALAPGFDNENPFKDGSAASFAAGSWSYVYLNPLTSPKGTGFPSDSSAVDRALATGELGFAPYLAAPGKDPVVLVNASGWAIPRGSQNAQAARQFIDYLMTPQRNADYAVAYGGLPALSSAADDPRFQTPYWKFVRENQDRYGAPIEPLADYDRATTRLAETITKVILDPQLDILAELKAAQDAYNATQ